MNKKLFFVVLFAALGIAGCRQKTKKTVYTPHNPEHTAVNVPAQTFVKNSSFDDDIEEFVLEHEVAPAHDTVALAPTFDLNWDDHIQEEKQVFNFDWDSSQIRKDQEPVLAADIAHKKAAALAGRKLEIVGHTCRFGTKAYNLALSEKRAHAIADRYEQAGIPRSNIKVLGIGSEELIAFDPSREGQSPNRRVEVSLV